MKPIVNCSQFKILLLILVVFGFAGIDLQAQKVKKKEVKEAIDNGGIDKLFIICPDKFSPSIDFELNLKIVLTDGTEVLASEHDVIWSRATVALPGATFDSRTGGVFASNMTGLVSPANPSEFYPDKALAITIELGGKKVTKSLPASFCYSSYTLPRSGASGDAGRAGLLGAVGRSGSDGAPGRNGGNGPNLDVQIEEEVIGGKTFAIAIVNGKKYPFDPTCGTINVVSRGGRGGRGGNGGKGGAGRKEGAKFYENGYSGGKGGEGGDGGVGGTVYVSGSKYAKYKSIFTFSSEGGSGGEGGNGGSGGAGLALGRAGVKGRDGRNGSPGQVNYQPMPSGTPEYSAPQQVVINQPSVDTKGDLLFTSDILVTLKLDGEEIGKAAPGQTLKYKTTQGEHLLEIVPEVAKDKVVTEVVEVKAASQVIKQIKLRSQYGPAEDKRVSGN